MRSVYSILYKAQAYSDLELSINGDLYKLHQHVLNEYEFFNTYIENKKVMKEDGNIEINYLDNTPILPKYFDIIFHILYDNDSELIDLEIRTLNYCEKINMLINLLIISDFFLLGDIKITIQSHLQNSFDEIQKEVTKYMSNINKLSKKSKESGILNSLSIDELHYICDHTSKNHAILYLMINLENELMYKNTLENLNREMDMNNEKDINNTNINNSAINYFKINWDIKTGGNLHNDELEKTAKDKRYIGFYYTGLIKNGYCILFEISGDEDIKKHFDNVKKTYSSQVRCKYVLYEGKENIIKQIKIELEEFVDCNSNIIEESVCEVNKLLKKYSKQQITHNYPEPY